MPSARVKSYSANAIKDPASLADCLMLFSDKQATPLFFLALLKLNVDLDPMVIGEDTRDPA
jgi:hypothetical protein